MGFEWWLLPIIAVPGGLGAVGRYLLDTHLKVVRGWSPVKSVAVVNLVGTGLLASLTLVAVFVMGAFGNEVGLTAAVMGVAALAGGFTTFSTAMVEAVKDRQGVAVNFMVLLLVLVMCCLLYVAILICGYLGVAFFFEHFGDAIWGNR